MTETRTIHDVPLQRWVGIGIASAAILISAFNVFGAPDAIRSDPAFLIMSPQVGVVFLIGIAALVSAFVPGMRWLQVALVIGTGVGAALDARSAQLTPFVWLLIGMLIAWEYGYFFSRGSLKAGVVTGLFLVVWIGRTLMRPEFRLSSVGVSIVGAALLGGFGWLLIVVKHREYERRQQELERAVAARTAEVADALSDQRLLLAELHHRTKNNLQIVSSILMFEEGAVGAAELGPAVQSAQRRIHSLGRVHDLLYSKTGVNEVDIGGFIADYLDAAVLMVDTRGMTIRRQLDTDIRVRVDLAIRLGLMLNEIVLNSMEHSSGGPDGRAMDVALRSEDSHLTLVATDDGPGVALDPGEREGLGIRLVESMAARLGGSAVLSNDGGTSWTIRLPLHRQDSRWD